MTDNVDVSRWPAPREGESQEQLKIMLAGKPYLAVDAYLCRVREEMATKMFEYNQERSGEKRGKMLEAMATLRPPKEKGQAQNTYITPPFTFEYVSLVCIILEGLVLGGQGCDVMALTAQGYNLNLGYDVYIGPNAQFIDVNESKSDTQSDPFDPCT